MKRLVAAGLWLYVYWYVGSMMAAMLKVPDLLGPTLGIAAALIIAIDHRKLVWTRRSPVQATSTTAASAG